MPDIIIKNEYGEDEVYRGVNTVRFLNEEGSPVSFKHSTGETYPRPNPAQHRVRFLDYDGFVLHEIYVDPGDTVYYPEVNPTWEGHVFTGWSKPLESLAAITRDVDVGALYVAERTTVDHPEVTSSSVMRLQIKDNTQSKDFSFHMYSMAGNTIEVDWGDETESTSRAWTSAGSYNFKHTYAEAGEYYVTVTRTVGEAEYSFGYFPRTTTTSNTMVGMFHQRANYTVTNLTLSSDITYIPFCAFMYGYAIKTITIPDSVTFVGGGAFYFCQVIESITIPDSVTSIGGKQLFSGCQKLKRVSLPSIDFDNTANMFSQCYDLESVTLPPTITTYGDRMFSQCYSLRELVIPYGVTSLANRVFDYCHSLKSVVIPDSVESIGSYTFEECYALSSIVLPSTLASFDSAYTFDDCYCLRGLELIWPDNITTVGTYAFAYVHLDQLVLHAGVTSIGSYAFYSGSVRDLYSYNPTPPTFNTSGMMNSNAGMTVHVPVGSVDAYKAAPGWSNFKNHIVGDL